MKLSVVSLHISKSEFKTVLEIISQIGENVSHEVVSQYQEVTEEYDRTSRDTDRIWENFLSYEVHHMLARIGIQKQLQKEHGINSVITGVDEDVDWDLFQNPWNSQISLTTEQLEKQTLVRGLQPHYQWVTLTERQYDRYQPDDLIGAAKISFRDWGNDADLTQPKALKITEVSKIGEVQQHPDHLEKIKEKNSELSDRGEYVMYKFNKNIDWMVEYNAPINIDIVGMTKAKQFKKEDGKSPDPFTADYFLSVDDMNDCGEYTS